MRPGRRTASRLSSTIPAATRMAASTSWRPTVAIPRKSSRAKVPTRAAGQPGNRSKYTLDEEAWLRLLMNRDESFARAQDERDPLVSFRDLFHIPVRPDGSPVIYLCTHSLGLQPKEVRRLMEEELD